MIKIGNIILEDFPVLLAPMEDVTDPPFRYFCKKFGADIMYTEFISSDGLIRDANKSIKKLDFYESERPIGIQIFGNSIEAMQKATEMAEAANPDLIDINFGCPVKKVVSKGCGSGIMNDIPKMVKITEAVVKATKLPVTVKTRLGWDENTKFIVDIAERLQDVGIKAITIHGRTRSQLYKGNADWTLIGEVKKNKRMIIPVIGNGDVDSPEKALEMKNRYDVDGIMIGRACIGNPWIFREVKNYLKNKEISPFPTLKERVDLCSEHLKKAIEWKTEKNAIFEMRGFYSGYFKNINNFKPFRIKLVTANTFIEIENIFADIINTYSE